MNVVVTQNFLFDVIAVINITLRLFLSSCVDDEQIKFIAMSLHYI